MKEKVQKRAKKKESLKRNVSQAANRVHEHFAYSPASQILLT